MSTDSLLLTTPQIVTIILGSVGLGIPVIDAVRKERGSSNHLYSAIAFGALIISISFVIFRVVTGQVVPAVQFNVSGVLSNDLFGSFFAIAFLIVSIMVTASSWNYMSRRANPVCLYSLILLSTIGMVNYRLFDRPSNVTSCLGIDVTSYICLGGFFLRGTLYQLRQQSSTLCSEHCLLQFWF